VQRLILRRATRRRLGRRAASALVVVASILWVSPALGQAVPGIGTAGSAVPEAELAEPLVAEPLQQPQSQIAPDFEPVVVDVPSLTATGYRFQPQQVDVPALTATGYRFQPQQVDVPALTATGYRFQPQQVDVPALTATRYRFQPQQVDVPMLTATGYAGALQPHPSDPQVADIQDTQPAGMEPAGPIGAGVFGGTHPGEPEDGVVGGPVDHPEAVEPALFVPVQVDTDTLRLTGIGPESRRPEAAEPALFAPVQIDTDTLRVTGIGPDSRRPEAAEPALHAPVRIDTDTLRLTGIGAGEPPGEPEGPLFELIRVVALTPGPLGTNPFDFQDLRADVTAAKTPRPIGPVLPGPAPAPVPGPGPTTPVPLSVSGVSYSFEGDATNIDIDALGPDTLSVRPGPGMFGSGPTADTALTATSGINEMLFAIGDPGSWQASTPPLPANFPNGTQRFVVRRTATGLFYQVTVGFTCNAGLQCEISSLSGWRCGTAAGSCP